MSGIKALKIGDLVLQRPVIQGGMGEASAFINWREL